jgi:hypothetical protein
MAVETGKHAFLDKEEYVKYVPHSEITEAEFYSQISNSKLVIFYLSHPARFIQGMKYTAGQSFLTRTALGKYQQKDSVQPISEFNRFTLWSSFREQYLPKNLLFLITVYISVFIISLTIFVRDREHNGVKSRVELFWGIMLIGLLQFPMPYLGNGQADTGKQLFLFNFVFDGMLVVLSCWCLSKLIDAFELNKFVKKGFTL